MFVFIIFCIIFYDLHFTNVYGPFLYYFRDELALGSHSKCPQYKNILQVVTGDKAHDIRARVPNSGLSVEQQVACLLNQATDPNILGRVYAGWEAWV